MPQRVLVLGAGGFIGRHVARALGATSWATPVAGVRQPGRGAALNIEECVVDAVDPGSLKAALGTVAAVVNCVAGNDQVLIDSARALFTAAKTCSIPPRIVHLSTMSVYGSATGLAIEDTSALRGDLGPYSAAKVDAESHASAYPRCVVLRPGCVFGPDSEQWGIRIARLLLARRLGDLGTAGDGCCNLIAAEDVALAAVRALERPEVDGRAYNLSMSGQPSWNEFLVRYAIALGAVPVRRVTGRRLRLETKLLAPPYKIAELVARRARLAHSPLPPPMPPSLIRLMGQDLRLDVRRAEADLGLQWTALAPLLERTARALRPAEGAT
jgi:nucleoside-diphosphate-sugar epimerase